MKYRVKAFDADGRDQVFTLDADDKHAAAAAIRTRGFFPFEVKPVDIGPASEPDAFAQLLTLAIGKAKAHPVVVGSATVVLSLVVIIFAVTAEGRRYNRAVKAYQSGEFESALTIVASLSPEYQARSTATYLKSDALLQLAQQEIENTRYDAALSHLKQIPTTFQRYGRASELIESTSSELDRIKTEQEEERRLRAAEAARVARSSSRTGTSSANVPEGFVWTGDREADQRRLDFVRELRSGSVRTFEDLDRAVRRHSTPSEIQEMEREIRRQDDQFNRAVPDPNHPGAWIWPDD